MAQKTAVDITKLRYVLYARKSTEDEARQVRSIDDQIRDCRKLAADLGLKVIGEPIKETKSAKRPDQRPLFSKMLNDLEAGKFDAILCWHPDRLCRNMLEGGRIINMLDEGTLKDIRFHSHQFSNDANGKMLLGMLFVFSKQYSDDLSDKVNRGHSGNLAEGKSAGAPKLGYDRSEITGLYEPNEHFEILQEAWENRVKGESIESITEYLLKNNVHRVTKNVKKQRVLKPTKSTVSNLFRDPFYYGVLVQSNQSVDLREVVSNFVPMVTKDTYDEVQLLGYGRSKAKFDKTRKTFYPLRGFVYCGVCNSPNPMLVGKNKTGAGKHVLSYRCHNKECPRRPRSLRAKHILNSIYETLDKFALPDEAYEHYSKQLDKYSGEKIVEFKQQILSNQGALTHIVKEINERSLTVGRMRETSPAYAPNIQHLEELTEKRSELESANRELQEKVDNNGAAKLSKEEFLNLAKSAAAKMRAGSAVEKDALCRILFLNLTVDNEKVAIYHWREPFATFVKATQIQSGGAGWI